MQVGLHTKPASSHWDVSIRASLTIFVSMKDQSRSSQMSPRFLGQNSLHTYYGDDDGASLEVVREDRDQVVVGAAHIPRVGNGTRV